MIDQANTDLKFDVIIPTKNSARTIRHCLLGLRRSDVPVNSIILIDKYSDDGTAEIAQRLGARVIQSPANCDEAKRLGASIATTSHVLILDSDVIINPHFYSKLKPYIRNHLVTKGATHYDLHWKGLSEWLFKSGWLDDALEAAFVEREKFLALTGDWDERHLDAGGDLVLFRICRERGIPVIRLCDAINIHLTGHFSRLWKQAFWYGRSDKKSDISPTSFAIKDFVIAPLRGLRAVCRTGDVRFLPYEVIYGLLYLLGWLRG